MKLQSKIGYALILTLLVVGFQNCSQQQMAFESASTSLINDGQSLGPEGPDDITLTTPIIKYPKLTIEPLPCDAGQICEVRISTGAPVEREISANWFTNDNLTKGSALYAVAGVHYIAASGNFVIPAGESSTIIRIQSKNWANESGSKMTLSIPLTVQECRMQGAKTSCHLFL